MSPNSPLDALGETVSDIRRKGGQGRRPDIHAVLATASIQSQSLSFASNDTVLCFFLLKIFKALLALSPLRLH